VNNLKDLQQVDAIMKTRMRIISWLLYFLEIIVR
jgi:hypothetical protein